MKTTKNKIETIVILFALLFGINSYAQKETVKKDMFIRVFNFEGKKINKGHVSFVGDSLLGLKKNGNYIEINVKEIGAIKTKRSAGHNILIGSAIGTATGAILGAASADPDAWIFGYTAAEGATGFGLAGALGGAAIGGISIAFKNSTTFTISGDLIKFKIFKETIDKQ
jgi:hypothetical protein